MIEDVGVKGRIILPVSTQPPILLPQLLLLLEFLHEDFLKNSKLKLLIFPAIYMDAKAQSRGRRFLRSKYLFYFYSYFQIILFCNSAFNSL